MRPSAIADPTSGAIRGNPAKGQRRLIDLKSGEIRSVKLEIIYNRDRSQVTDSDQKYLVQHREISHRSDSSRTHIYLGLVGIDMRHCSMTPDHTSSREAVATLRRAKSPPASAAASGARPSGRSRSTIESGRLYIT